VEKSLGVEAAHGVWRQLSRSRLSVRLAILSAALTALVTCGTFAALSAQVRNSTRQLLSDELARNGRTLVSLQRDERRHLVLTAALLAESPSLRSAISTYRVEQQAGSGSRADLTATVEHELAKTVHDLGGGTLLATDARGRVFAGYASGHTPQMLGADLSAMPAVRNALDPALAPASDEVYRGGLELGDAYYSVGVAPLILDGFTIGTIVYGEPVDSALAMSLRRSFQGDVVISAGQRIVSSTLASAGPLDAAIDAARAELPVRLGGEEYLIAGIPVGRTQRGTELRITLLQPLGPAVRTLTNALRRDFLLYGALAILLAALGTSMLSRSLLLPLRRFIALIRTGAEQERMDATFDADDASLEIRALNDSFVQLMTSLDGKRNELERRGVELAAANEVLTDEISGRERVERALRDSEAQLRQSQKLEAVGTLAGGIAHDFNNLLTVISGFTQLVQMRLGADHEVAADLREVADASQSAASLTHQLLAFSRKQVLRPQLVHLDEVVRGMERLLQRLIGSHITLAVTHDGDVARITADPGQIEQVVLNLAVNARDAMPDGGTLTIELENVSVTERDRSRSKDLAPGDYVRLVVGDTGTGMPQKVIDRAFDPFFTTKLIGEGTGLGLSMIFGFAKQSKGHVAIESTVGQGTKVSLFLPRASTEVLATTRTIEASSHAVTGETVLVVDDEATVRLVMTDVLTGLGYHFVEAPDGDRALAILRSGQKVDLLVTDVGLPGINGRQLSEMARQLRPGLGILFVTGYAAAASIQGGLNDGTDLLCKPFTLDDFAEKVRSMLADAERRILPAFHS
jgi:signal transduction histidine kinase/ActR/RegA family two-component response regulator